MRTPPAARTGYAATGLLATRREAMAAALEAENWMTEPPPITETIGGVRTLRFNPPLKPRATVVHFHGGAYRLGAPETSGHYAVALALACGAEVLCPAYRLAPEHPFPSGLIDALAVIEGLPRDKPLILSGDSAGGGMAASLTQLCVDRGIALAGLILHSAWLDLTVSHESFVANAATDPLFSRQSAQEGADLYLQGLPAETPLASTLHADLAGFPPTFLSVGTGEVLAGDAFRFKQALAAAGVPATLLAVDGMDHVAVTRDRTHPGAVRVFEATVDFVNGRLEGPG